MTSVRRRPAATAVLALAAMAVLILGPATAAQASVLVKAGGSENTFRPKLLNVNKGTKVVWKDVGGTHTVTAYSKNWSKSVTLSTGQTTSFTFKATGRYKYRCVFHSTLVNGVCSGMCGKVVVG